MGTHAPRHRRSRLPDAANAEPKKCPACARTYPADYRVCPQDGTPLEAPAGADDDPLIGEVLGGAFCIVGVVGEGGMGRVYEAEHVRLPRRYAVKVIAPALARNQEAMGRFEREAQAAAKVVHPNVLDVVDVVRAKDGRPCMISELLEGEELGMLLDREKKLPVAQAVEICRQACRGLAAAHAEGIVHRDLKPANLFVCTKEDGSVLVKVLDFGVAKMTDGASLTRTGTVVGTPAYMAPEQARGMPGVDGRADVYSLGAVLYQLATGVPPFWGDEPAKILMQVATEDPPPMRAVDPTVPEMLEAIVQGAMAKEPERRFASATEFESQLAAFVREPDRSSRVAPAAVPAHSPTLVDPLPAATAHTPSNRPPTTLRPAAPSTSPFALLANAFAALGAVAGLVLVLVSSRKELADATFVLSLIFALVAFFAAAGAAFVVARK